MSDEQLNPLVNILENPIMMKHLANGPSKWQSVFENKLSEIEWYKNLTIGQEVFVQMQALVLGGKATITKVYYKNNNKKAPIKFDVEYESGEKEANVQGHRIEPLGGVLDEKWEKFDTQSDDVPILETINPLNERAIRITLMNDETGEEDCICIVDKKSLTGLWLNQRYHQLMGYNPSKLNYYYNGKDISSLPYSSTPDKICMKDGDKIYVKGIPSPKIFNFICENGEVITIQVKNHNTHVSKLLADYAVQKGMPIPLSCFIFQFSYTGKLIARVDRPIKDAFPNIQDITIYVKEQLGLEATYDMREENLVNSCKKIVNDIPPECFKGQKLSTDDLIVTVVDYSTDSKLWTIEYENDDGIVSQREGHTKEELAISLSRYYTRSGGLENDLSVYFKGVMDKHTGAFNLYKDSRLVYQVRSGYKFRSRSNALTLNAIRLQQDMGQTCTFLVSITNRFNGDKIQVFVKWQNELKKLSTSLMDYESEMKKDIRYAANKPVFGIGDSIIVAEHGISNQWKSGVIIPREEEYILFEEEYEYNPDLYSVRFENGEQVDNIKGHQILLEEDFLISKHSKESEWKGVQRVVDIDSPNKWEREVGWYIITHEGVEDSFAHLSDALRAYDIRVIYDKDGEVQESDLNFPKDWISGLDRVHINIYIFMHTMMVVNDRISDPIMRRIGRHLIHFLHPRNKQKTSIGFTWKEAQGLHLDNVKKVDVTYPLAIAMQLNTVSAVQQNDAASNIRQICHYFIAAEGNINDFLIRVPTFHENYSITPSGFFVTPDEFKAFASCKPENDNFMFIKIQKENDTQRHVVARYEPLKHFITRYADENGTSIKSLRIKHNDRTLFISGIGKKTPEDLSINEDDILDIAIMSTATEATVEQPKQKSKGKKNTKKKKHKKSKKKRPVQIAPPEDLKGEHSKLLGKIHEEAEPTFKEIRQRLNAMNLERTKPKQRTSPSKSTKPIEVVDSPLGESQVGGKAGKTQFIVQVGEVSNLYKTTKPSSAGRGRREDDTLIDLHGLTAEEAVCRLDRHLPDWIETAMKGTYPFVIPVKIVCGGGSQILAEVVENWIKQNDNVANAPKNMYS